jgi:hypothetical protein
MTLEEFYAKCDVIKPDENGCLSSPGNRWGRVYIDGVARIVPRVALERKLGRPILPGHMALHGCDNPQCFSTEPGHVYEGSHSRNMQDRSERQPESFDNLREWANSPENKEHCRSLEHRERCRGIVNTRWNKARQEAAERRRWVEAALAKQEEAQP